MSGQRRSRHEGSVHQLGERWIAVVELPKDARGRRRRRRRFADTKTEALKLLRQMKREVEEQGTTADRQRSVIDAVGSYWETRQGSQRTTGTLERDRWMLDLVEEGLGHKRVTTLSVGDCDDFLRSVANGLEQVDGTTRKPLVREHVSRVRSVLRRVLANEVRLGFQSRNVADLAEMPETPAESRTHRLLTADELRKLLTASSGAVQVLIDLCGRNGLRPQEARAVQWADIDLTSGTMDVGPQMNGQGLIVGPKTPRAPRTIEIDERTVSLLKKWIEVQSASRATAGELWRSEYDLLITTGVGTTISGNNVRRSLRSLSKKTGLTPTVRPYDLRHTAITLQSKQGYSDWELADWAGTSERMINEVYRHRTDRVVSVRPLDC